LGRLPAGGLQQNPYTSLMLRLPPLGPAKDAEPDHTDGSGVAERDALWYIGVRQPCWPDATNRPGLWIPQNASGSDLWGSARQAGDPL
jgi:hypothetical protein